MKTLHDTRLDTPEKPRPVLQHPAIWTSAFRLARGALIALAASLFINFALTALAVALAFRPADVIVIDKLGDATFIPKAEAHPAATDLEVEEFARNWTKAFLSQDGVTAKEDFAHALSLVHPSLQPELKRRFVDSGLLERIADAFVRADVRVEASHLSQESSGRLMVTVSGKRVLVPMGAKTTSAASEPFALTLVLQRTHRTESTPNGLLVRYLASNTDGAAYEVGNKQ